LAFYSVLAMLAARRHKPSSARAIEPDYTAQRLSR